MNARTLLAAAVAAAMMTMTVNLFAAEPSAPRPAYKSEPIVGYGMMNDGERNDYRKRMREARSEQERQTIRDEHRKLMETRAKERGVTLPEQRGPRGEGKGAGYGPGGMGKGYGPEGKGPGYGPGGMGKGVGPEGKGPGYGPGGQGKGVGPEGKGPGYGPGGQGKGVGPEGKGPGNGPGYGKGPGYGPDPRP
jgi:hypothetical protein